MPLTNSPSSQAVLHSSERALSAQIFAEKLRTLNRTTNVTFIWLLAIQWVFAIGLVLVVSPYTWIGTSHYVHVHVWSTIILGGLLTLYPIGLAITCPDSPWTPHVIGAAQMGWSALLIHITGGRIESHFHVFGSLAFLAFYRDWKVMCTASVVVILDHAIRGILWPQSVFGIASGAEWRWLEHGGWVVFEDLFLIAACFRGRKELFETSVKQAGLELSFRNTEREVEIRTQELREATALADSANRAKSEFLANMSHEIRTPLTAILGYADLLRDDTATPMSTEDRLQTLETIRSAGHHLLTVINDVLDLSKIEANRMSVETVRTPLVRILAEVESLIRPRAAGKGVELQVRLLTPVPSHIFCDPTRLRQILMNLLGNAAKFTQAGEVVLEAAVLEGEDGKQLSLLVKDTGPGMSLSQAKALFEPFVQADSTVSRQFGGTGLGLSISRRLARLLGGEVLLDWTELGRGSHFRVLLPLVEAEGATEISSLSMLRMEPRRVAIASQVALLGQRILLAEDGPDNQRLIRFFLQKSGAEVEVAENGAVALRRLQEAERDGSPFDLLLTDMQMPEMDGYTLTRRLRQANNAIPIVALTAHAMAEDRKRCMDAGCSDYTTKPVDRQHLIETCRQWLLPSIEQKIAQAMQPPTDEKAACQV